MRRHPQFTEATKNKIYEDLRDKGEKETAALAGGISVSTLKKWIKNGEVAETKWAEQGVELTPEEQEYLDFVVEYRKADYEGRMKLRVITDSLLTSEDGNRPDVGLLKLLLKKKSVYPDAIPLEDQLRSPLGGSGRILGILIQEQPRLPAPSPASDDFVDVTVERVEEETD